MEIYIDLEYKCHVSNDGTMREFDVPFFDGKCKDFVEGFVFVPEGEKLILKNGIICEGEQRFPWKDYTTLAAAQAAYEEGQATGTGGIDELVSAAGDAYTEGVNSAYDS